MYSQITFFISAFSGALILILFVTSSLSNNFQFWPPPDKDYWQHRTFLLLFRGFLYPLIVLTTLQFELLHGDRALLHYGIGAMLFTLGFGLAFWITFSMGWRNAFGEKLGLRTTGWFALSRNPVYVATWIGMVGWGLIANSNLVWLRLTIWAFMYVIAPFHEEPWLEETYGDDFRAYKAKTRRFI